MQLDHETSPGEDGIAHSLPSILHVNPELGSATMSFSYDLLTLLSTNEPNGLVTYEAESRTLAVSTHSQSYQSGQTKRLDCAKFYAFGSNAF
eukprot:450963-Amphidinium_carterae.3